MQQYYLHNEFINNGLRQNVKPVKVNNNQILCMTNDNIIEFYEYTQNGIRYQSKHSTNCNIAKLQILPTKQMHKDDYLFIIDKKGRYGVWRVDSGFQKIQNTPAQSQFSLYKNEDEVDQVSFSGEIHHFDVFDTKGSVFFTFKHKILIIDYTITRMGINIERTRNISIPYVQYRYINWVKSSKKGKFIGIIEQIQEKTILKVHNIENSSKITHQNKVFERQKVNLTDFISENDELLLVSDDEINGISLKTYTQLFTHNFHNYNGKVIKLNQQTYCFIGQQMLVFNNEKIISYGSFREEGINIFQKKGVLQARCLRTTEDNGFMVSVSTFNNQIYFLILYEHSWKLYYHLKALTSIYSIYPTDNPHSIVAVMDESIDQFQVVFVEKQALTPLVKQQSCQITIDRLISIEKGKYMAVLSQQTNILMKYNEIASQFEFVRQLPKGNILLISNNIMITDSALYTVSLEDSFHEQLVRQDVILTAHNNNRVIYMDGQGVVKMITTEPFDITLLRNNAFDEYAWHLLQNNDLLVAKTSNPLSLYVYHQDNTISEIGLVENCLISSIYHFIYENQSIVEETIVIGYMNGSIHLYSMGGQIKAKLNAHSNEPVSFYNINKQLLGIACGSKQFILSNKNGIFSIKAIQFSKNGNIITSVMFLETANKFIFVENNNSQSGKLIRMISLSDVYDGLNIATNNHDSYRIKTIINNLKQIPTVFLYKQYILVGINSNLLVYHVQSGRLVKTLSNYIQDVLGMAVLECGLIVYGIDSIKRNLLYVYSHELQEQYFINFIMKDNKYIKNIKQIPNSNRFLCRGETFTTLCQLNNSKEIIQILQFKTDLIGYSLQIDSENNFLAQTDSKRLLIVLSYAGSMLPIARFVNTSEINDFLMLHRCVLIGDKAGYLHLLEFNTEDPNEALRMSMTKVASINVGQQVTTLSKKSSTQALYGTVSGRIGSIHIISEQNFKILKPSEETSLKELKRGRDFEYSGWRGRNINEDKLIDGTLVKQFLHDKSKQMLNQHEKSSFQETHTLFEKLVI